MDVNPAHVHMDPADASIVQALADHMVEILGAFRNFGRFDPKWAARDPSPFNDERALLQRQYGPHGSWSADAAEYAGDAALLFLLAQADHLTVLHQIYSSRAGLMFGVGPSARSLLEINGYVFWLLHPHLDSIRTRAARSLLSQLNDASRERAAAKDLGAPARHMSEVGERVNALKEKVTQRFYPSEIQRDKSGRLILRGERHPGPGEALRHLSIAGAEEWNSRGAYSFLSNAAHPTLHVITDTIQTDGDGVPTRFGHADTQFHYRLARMAMAGFLYTWQITAAYRGLDQDPIRRLLLEIDTLPEP
ncbi:hypothetical protein [Terrabacter carboxydivorans]|uniref:Uncharacterized protein n=1 Tax=Terrabacter carboxydivorans TaxID=619730 RepID=A0ABN3MGE4_9MICO